MFVRTSCIALATAVALTAVAGAAPANRSWSNAASPPPRVKSAKTLTVARTKGSEPVRPPAAGTIVMAISAFPAGGRGSGTEATCELWSDRLQEAEDAVGEATETQDKIDAVNDLNADIDNALDAGCVVIYSQASPQLSRIRTVALAEAAAGGFVTTQWSAGTSVAYISAFPTGGRGSATEATCALWSERLQADQERVDRLEAEENPEVQDAQEILDASVDHALDAGCVVIH